MTVDLAYLRNLGGDYSTYTVAKTATLTDGSRAGLTIDGVRPILAFAKNGYPLVTTAGDTGYVATGAAGAVVDNDGGPLTLLSSRLSATYLPAGAHLDDVTGIDLSVEVPTDTHSGAAYADLAAQTISFTGAGIDDPSTPTVADLEKHIELGDPRLRRRRAAPGEYHGLDLLSLLQCSAFGLAVDADSVTVTGADGSSVSLPIADLTQQASPALFRSAGRASLSSSIRRAPSTTPRPTTSADR